MPAKKTAAKKTTTKKTPAKKTKKAASPKARTASTKVKPNAKTNAGDKEITIDRRTKANRRDESSEQAAAPVKQTSLERREKVQRRRQIDPTTCERDYSVAEVEFMNAMDDYKRTSGRMFPTCSEVLEVIRNLGYTQLSPAEIAIIRPEPIEVTEINDDTQDDFEDAELETADAAF